ncbi:MAG: hypothetical protein IPG71_07050 [bacterium]|nr:hypothetical protein [bacterium]
MYARRGDPAAVMDFAVMASANADSLGNDIFTLLWDTSQDTTIHDKVRDRAIWALQWYQRDSVETLIEAILYEPEFELTSARVLAKWKLWTNSLDALVGHEDWTTLVLNGAPSIEDSLVVAENSGSPSGRMGAAFYLEEVFGYTGERAKEAEEVLEDYVVSQQSYADTINLSRGVSYAVSLQTFWHKMRYCIKV